MTQSFQLDRHPDAESLSAFVERALPEWEQRQVMSHLAGCRRCREIVFLAQEVAEGGVEAQVAGQRGAGTWWKNWRFVWVPAAVCTAIVVAGINFELTRKGPASDGAVMIASGSGKVVVSRTEPEFPIPVAPVRRGQEVVPGHSAPIAKPKGSITSQDEAASTTREQETPLAGPVVLSGALSANEPLKNSAQAAPAEPSGRPVAPVNSFATTQTVVVESSAQMLSETPTVSSTLSSASLQPAPSTDKKIARQSQATLAKASPARKQDARPAKQAGSALSRSVVVKGADSMAPVPALDQAQARAKAAYGMGQSAANFSISAGAVTSSADAFAARNAMDTRLPSGLAAVSTAGLHGHLLAIDPTGLVFLSEDMGRTWSSVTRPWTGRGVTVRVTSSPGSNSQEPVGGVSAALFEIVTDNGSKWTSVDGRVWNPKLP